MKGRPNFVTACLLFSKRVKPEQPPKVGGGKPTKSKRPKRSKAPRPEAETITPYAKARRTLENTLSAIEKMVNLNLQDEHLLRPPTGIKTLQIEALLYLQKYQDPKDVKPQELVEIKNQELEELIQHIKTQIDEIKIALEEERAGETNRINDTLKVIVNGLITRLEGLRSDHLVELISFLKNYTP